jgi:fucose permease
MERAMVTGVILAFGVIFGTGFTPFILGTIADHYNFQVGILGVGIVTTLSSLLVGLLKKTEEAPT